MVLVWSEVWKIVECKIITNIESKHFILSIGIIKVIIDYQSFESSISHSFNKFLVQFSAFYLSCINIIFFVQYIFHIIFDFLEVLIYLFLNLFSFFASPLFKVFWMIIIMIQSILFWSFVVRKGFKRIL